MPIRLDCPRCKKLLSVPKKKIGSYVHCPRCGGRFWVTDPEASGAHSPKPALPPQASAEPTAAAAPPAESIEPETPAPSPPSLPPARKVARFITADTVESPLKLAEDGRLPELRLKESGQSDGKTQDGPALSPWLLAVLLCVSVAMSAALVFVDLSPQDQSSRQQAATARRIIEEEYFANLDPTSLVEPYQFCLREARRARSAGDVAGERERYRKVLDLLRAERGNFDRGLTGSRARDRRLEEQITIILNEP